MIRQCLEDMVAAFTFMFPDVRKEPPDMILLHQLGVESHRLINRDREAD